MLKVAKDDVRDGYEESNNAVVLGEEYVLEEKEENKCPKCEEDITLKQLEDLFGVLVNHKVFRQEIVDNLNKYIKQKKREGSPLQLVHAIIIFLKAILSFMKNQMNIINN